MRNEKSIKNRRLWNLYVAIALALVIITFSPLILAPGKILPTFLSLPYTLWSSMLISIILVLLTYLASRVMHKD